MINFFKKIKLDYCTGKNIRLDNSQINGVSASCVELKKTPSRTEVINFLLSKIKNKATNYLEIGVRNPNDNFNNIKATNKYSVDPGVEFKENPVDFKMTSDCFFEGIKKGDILKNITFDVIFIDGLHLADQVERDINNAISILSDNGFIVIHDCNPPSEYHAREQYNYNFSPAGYFWNGTVWKSFYKCRFEKNISCCCIDADWGIGIITKQNIFGHLSHDFNPFFEYHIFNEKRKESLNLIHFDEFKIKLNSLY